MNHRPTILQLTVDVEVMMRNFLQRYDLDPPHRLPGAVRFTDLVRTGAVL